MLREAAAISQLHSYLSRAQRENIFMDGCAAERP